MSDIIRGPKAKKITAGRLQRRRRRADESSLERWCHTWYSQKTYKQATWSSLSEEARNRRALADNQTTTNTPNLSAPITHNRSNTFHWGNFPFYIWPLFCLHKYPTYLLWRLIYTIEQRRFSRLKRWQRTQSALHCLFLKYWIHGATFGIADLHHPPPPGRMRA